MSKSNIKLEAYDQAFYATFQNESLNSKTLKQVSKNLQQEIQFQNAQRTNEEDTQNPALLIDNKKLEVPNFSNFQEVFLPFP